MDIGALSVRGNHDHEVVRQGLKFRHRSTDNQDRDRDRERERERESREREKEKDSNQERDRGNSGASVKSRPSVGSVNGTGAGAGAGAAAAPGSEAPGGRPISSRVQQHLELGTQHPKPLLILFMTLLFSPYIHFWSHSKA